MSEDKEPPEPDCTDATVDDWVWWAQRQIARLSAQVAAMRESGKVLADRFDAFMESEYNSYWNEESDAFRKAAGLIEE